MKFAACPNFEENPFMKKKLFELKNSNFVRFKESLLFYSHSTANLLNLKVSKLNS